jgi:hypothetical protein
MPIEFDGPDDAMPLVVATAERPFRSHGRPIFASPKTMPRFDLTHDTSMKFRGFAGLSGVLMRCRGATDEYIADLPTTEVWLTGDDLIVPCEQQNRLVAITAKDGRYFLHHAP